jgi:hypothetical protein
LRGASGDFRDNGQNCTEFFSPTVQPILDLAEG